jgi:hypothetical protein
LLLVEAYWNCVKVRKIKRLRGTRWFKHSHNQKGFQLWKAITCNY